MHGSDNELRDPRPTAHRERLAAQIRQHDLNLAAVVGIDRAGRIEHSDTVTRRKTGARSHLTFVTLRQRDRYSGWYERASPRRDHDRRLGRYRREKIEAGGIRTLVLR